MMDLPTWKCFRPTEHELSGMDDVVFRLVKQIAEFADRLVRHLSLNRRRTVAFGADGAGHTSR
jgi:hypothetical protein